MVIFLIVLAVGITFLGWQLYKKKVAVPTTSTPVPQSDTQPGPIDPSIPPKDPIDRSVTGVILGTVTEALLGGKPAANGPAPGAAVDSVDYGSVMDKPNVSYAFPAGIKPFSLPVKGGSRYTVEVVPYGSGYGSGNVAFGPLVQAIVNGYGQVTLQPQDDGVQTVTVNCDKSGLVRFSVV